MIEVKRDDNERFFEKNLRNLNYFFIINNKVLFEGELIPYKWFNIII